LSSINAKLNQILINQETSDNLIAATTQKLQDFDYKQTSLTSQMKTVTLTQKQTSTTVKASAFTTAPPTPPPAPGLLNHGIRSVLKEHELQKSRKLNLIIYRLKDNKAHSQEERKRG
jgi:hypothetical protein